jgi:pyrophosphatase PpaX
MTPRWPVVIFDIDGTLVDSVDLIVQSYQHAFRTVLGREWDTAEIKTWIGQSLRDALHRADPDHGAELFDTYTAWNEAHTDELIRGFAGVPELASDLAAAGVRLGAATSKRREPAVRTLQLGGLAGTVPLLVAHEDVPEHKPSPLPLLLAAEKLNCAPADAVYIGDAAVDIQAARNAGMASIGVTWGAGTRADLIAAQPGTLVDTVDQLRAALLGN